VADDAKKPAAAQASPSDKDLLPQEKDVLFQAQMAVANVFLGYYKYGLGLLGVVLLVALVYGIADSVHTKSQRNVHARIAEVQNELTDPSDKAALGKAATDLEGIAEKGDGTAAVMALPHDDRRNVEGPRRPCRAHRARREEDSDRDPLRH
jgi:hypothetical protein